MIIFLEKWLQGCRRFSGLPESLLRGCLGVSGVPEKWLLGCRKFSGSPESLLQGCLELSENFI
ncbi:hypothetical protein UN65_03015 [Flavobacterium columnare]|uniref:Uncharacterized protein n=1 Tax=Flavobacterium columnare TaxID=996 RepID=A0AAI8CG31_9FLAO|nr:hypothetical protein UN65_03015 [Flavobacterium columnare]